MENLFNDYVKSLETYIMFRIKQKAAELAPELEKKGRAPIALAMGAPVVAPPEFVTKKLTEALALPDIHTYSSPRGEKFYLESPSPYAPFVYNFNDTTTNWSTPSTHSEWFDRTWEKQGNAISTRVIERNKL